MRANQLANGLSPRVELRRTRTADDIRAMRSFGNSSDSIPQQAHSEGHHVVPKAEISFDATSIEREILSSRSLFDPRWIPQIPEENERTRIDVSTGQAESASLSKLSRLSLKMVRLVRIVQYYFVFLQLGIITALLWANIDEVSYSELWQGGDDPHSFTFHFFINDVFMAFFFGIAMVHVTTSLRPGGSLSPLKRAITPLLGTIGGVVGPAVLYLALVAIEGRFDAEAKGWAICIATDISVAWLVATMVFKSGSHPAVEFLLLLAVADDVIGLIVIAIAFPSSDMNLIWLLLVAGAVCVCCTLRWGLKLERWFFYIFIAGPVSWYGMYRAGIHPALALCVVVPFIPGKNVEKFDHNCSLVVHIGLFFFALCNAGVAFGSIGFITLNVALSLVIGKTLGISLFTLMGTALFGLQLPEGLGKVHLALLAHISGAGLTVALFVSELAFKDPSSRDQARLGALISIVVAPISIILSRFLNVEQKNRIVVPV